MTRHLGTRYRGAVPANGGFWTVVATAGASGAIVGLTLGIVAGHFVLALVPAAVLATAFSIVTALVRRS